MAVDATERKKPLAVRATEAEHRLIAEAARREHRSISSFVLHAALVAAKTPESKPRQRRSPEEIRKIVEAAQREMRQYRQPGRSLVKELIAERRAEAARE